ncbi:MAG: hypothetical protein HOP04_10925 [Methylophilaceae bacterium]|nr:hypothetical protein [Methylophilaceae bacterium]
MIEPRDFEDQARGIVGTLPTEVKFRTGISRAYYAAFHYCNVAAKTWCNQLPNTEKKDKGIHEQLYCQLQKPSNLAVVDSSLRSMAELAKKLKFLRVDADYHLDKTISNKEYTSALSYMSNVKKELEEAQRLSTSTQS